MASTKLILCLSGGGFRATIFHFGVVDYLRERGLLERLDAIFGVSGGALTAAVLCNNWAHACGDNTQYSDMLSKVHKFASSGAILRAYIRAIVSGKDMFTSFAQLVNQDLPNGKSYTNAPSTYLISSSLTCDMMIAHEVTNNMNYAIVRSGATYEFRNPQKGIAGDWANAAMRSACFPLVFSPQEITQNDIPGIQPATQLLADGGILDNLGLRGAIAWKSAHGANSSHTLLISDAAAALPEMLPQVGRSTRTIRGALRTIDYLMNSVADSAREHAMSVFNDVRHVALREVLHGRFEDGILSHLDGPTRTTVATMRTNFDRFSDREIVLLHQSGYACAKRALEIEPAIPQGGSSLNSAISSGYSVGSLPLSRPIEPRRHSSLGNENAMLVWIDQTIARPSLAALTVTLILLLLSAGVAVLGYISYRGLP